MEQPRPSTGRYLKLRCWAIHCYLKRDNFLLESLERRILLNKHAYILYLSYISSCRATWMLVLPRVSIFVIVKTRVFFIMVAPSFTTFISLFVDDCSDADSCSVKLRRQAAAFWHKRWRIIQQIFCTMISTCWNRRMQFKSEWFYGWIVWIERVFLVSHLFNVISFRSNLLLGRTEL